MEFLREYTSTHSISIETGERLLQYMLRGAELKGNYRNKLRRLSKRTITEKICIKIRMRLFFLKAYCNKAGSDSSL